WAHRTASPSRGAARPRFQRLVQQRRADRSGEDWPGDGHLRLQHLQVLSGVPDDRGGARRAPEDQGKDQRRRKVATGLAQHFPKFWRGRLNASVRLPATSSSTGVLMRLIGLAVGLAVSLALAPLGAEAQHPTATRLLERQGHLAAAGLPEAERPAPPGVRAVIALSPDARWLALCWNGNRSLFSTSMTPKCPSSRRSRTGARALMTFQSPTFSGRRREPASWPAASLP